MRNALFLSPRCLPRGRVGDHRERERPSTMLTVKWRALLTAGNWRGYFRKKFGKICLKIPKSMQGKVTHLLPFLNPEQPVVHESLSESAHKGGMLAEGTARSQPVPAWPDAGGRTTIGKAKHLGLNHHSQHQRSQAMMVGGCPGRRKRQELANWTLPPRLSLGKSWSLHASHPQLPSGDNHLLLCGERCGRDNFAH